MEEIKIEILMQRCQMDELPESDRQLVEQARKSTYNSYAPYSHFSVGAAVRMADGTVVCGANQEDAAFPSGLCAERTAIFAAAANHPNQAVEAIAIAARGYYGDFLRSPITPCGACRQVILGMEDRHKKPLRVLLYGQSGTIVVRSIRDLVPLSFVDDNMKDQ